MFKGYLLIVISISVLLVPFSLCNDAKAQLVYLAGVEDDFATPVDVASPSTMLSTAFENHPFGGIQNFDLTSGLNGGSNNRAIAHTFSNLPPGITGATLEFRIKAGGTSDTPDDDFWFLFYDVATPEFDINKKAYRFAIGNREGPEWEQPQPVGLAGIEWIPGSDVIITLDLSALPISNVDTMSVLEDLASYGFLDVVVNDDTAVDYYKLTVYPTTANDVLNIFEDSVENGDLDGSRAGWVGELQIWIIRMLLEYADESIEEGFIDRACFLLERAYMRSDGEARPLRDIVEGPAKDDLADMILDLMANQACE